MPDCNDLAVSNGDQAIVETFNTTIDKSVLDTLLGNSTALSVVENSPDDTCDSENTVPLAKTKTMPNQAVELAQKNCVFVKGDDGKSYIIIDKKKGFFVFPLKGEQSKSWLKHQYFKKYRRGLSSAALAEALDTLDALIQHEYDEQAVYYRVARIDNKIFIDVGDEYGSVYEVTENGWRLLEESPVLFVHETNMKALPRVNIGGNIQSLRRFINVSDEQFPLIIGFILAAFSGKIPIPILLITGGADRGKTTAMRFIRLLIDPAKHLIYGKPKNVDDFYVMVSKSYVSAFDNISNIGELSDAICLCSTGGTHAKRALYTDDDTYQTDVARSLMFTGIGSFAKAGDLLSRSFEVQLEKICAVNRGSEDAFEKQFEMTRPEIFAGILDALVSALKYHQTINTTPVGRMVDVERWVTAAEKSFNPTHTFRDAYLLNSKRVLTTPLDNSLIAYPLLDIMRTKGQWQVSPTELLHTLENHVGASVTNKKEFPSTASVLTDQIKRLESALNAEGLDVSYGRKSSGRYIDLKYHDTMTGMTTMTATLDSNTNSTDSFGILSFENTPIDNNITAGVPPENSNKEIYTEEKPVLDQNLPSSASSSSLDTSNDAIIDRIRNRRKNEKLPDMQDNEIEDDDYGNDYHGYNDDDAYRELR